MRPAHQAREVLEVLPDCGRRRPASMRPAHQAREVQALAIDGWPVQLLQ